MQFDFLDLFSGQQAMSQVWPCPEKCTWTLCSSETHWFTMTLLPLVRSENGYSVASYDRSLHPKEMEFNSAPGFLFLGI